MRVGVSGWCVGRWRTAHVIGHNVCAHSVGPTPITIAPRVVGDNEYIANWHAHIAHDATATTCPPESDVESLVDQPPPWDTWENDVGHLEGIQGDAQAQGKGRSEGDGNL